MITFSKQIKKNGRFNVHTILPYLILEYSGESLLMNTSPDLLQGLPANQHSVSQVNK
jgi:hypothetical protein